MQKWRSWEAASEAQWGLALEREAVIRPLAEQQRLSAAAVEEAVQRLKLSRSVLYDLVRRYRQRPQTSSLLPWKRGRDARVRMLEPEREELLQVCLREFYLTSQRPSIAALAREVRRRFSELQLPVPNYRTVQRRVESLDQRLVVGKREGSKRAREKFGPVGIST